MWLAIKKLFKNGYIDQEVDVEKYVNVSSPKTQFTLTVDGIRMGNLLYDNGVWYFSYTNEFKNHLDEYNLIIGFPDVNKIYKSEVLWPFFQIRIPGLKQPAVKEILKEENIDEHDEVRLLKYFGKKTIANPYELVVS